MLVILLDFLGVIWPQQYPIIQKKAITIPNKYELPKWSNTNYAKLCRLRGVLVFLPELLLPLQ